MIRIIGLTLAIALVAPAASAEQYWITYEGDDFPEEQGWIRQTMGGGAVRYVDEGWLVIDSRASVEIVDFYRMQLDGDLDPGPGELFVAQWRLCIDELTGSQDPGIGVFSDDKWAASFTFDEGTVRSAFEPGVTAEFEPGVYHDFEFRSSDMLNYELLIDGEPAIQGAFWLSLTEPRFGWGDVIQGGASLSRWDYVRFGVVPEPSGSLVAVYILALVRRYVPRNRVKRVACRVGMPTSQMED